MHKDAPHLDGAYAAFGKITEGMDVVNKIAETTTDYSDRPLEKQVMKTVTVETFGIDYRNRRNVNFIVSLKNAGHIALHFFTDLIFTFAFLPLPSVAFAVIVTVFPTPAFLVMTTPLLFTTAYLVLEEVPLISGLHSFHLSLCLPEYLSSFLP